MRGEHGLRAPQMRVGRHQRVAGLLGLCDERRDDAHDQAIDRDQPAAQVEPQIDADLLVARAARMEALAGVADALDELALDPRVDVLVVALHDPRILAHRVEQRRQGAVDGGVLVGREHAGRADRLGPRQAAGDVVLDEALVEREGPAELEDVLVGLSGEAAGPQIAHERMIDRNAGRVRRPA